MRMKYQKGNMFKKMNKNIFALILVGILIFISCSKENNYNYLPQQLGELSLGKVIQNKKYHMASHQMCLSTSLPAGFADLKGFRSS